MQGINFVFFLEKLPGPRLPAARPRTARPGPEIGCAAAAAAASPARSFFSPWPARDSERRPPCRRPCRAASPPLRSAFLSPPPPESPRSSSEDFFLVVVVLLLLLPRSPPLRPPRLLTNQNTNTRAPAQELLPPAPTPIWLAVVEQDLGFPADSCRESEMSVQVRSQASCSILSQCPCGILG